MQTVIISRTDAIGDVVLTLPLASLIKNLNKDSRVLFFGRSYTFPVINCCEAVDEFIDYDVFKGLNKKEQSEFLKATKADTIIHVFPRSDIARASKNAGIETRIGTTNRLYHWMTCNRLVRLGRKNSNLHEAQLNVKLLKPLGHSGEISLDELINNYRFNRIPDLTSKFKSYLSGNKFKIILHPKSHLSGREWPLQNYRSLIDLLPEDKFQFIITGGEKEAGIVNEWAGTLPKHVINFAGKLTLDELIALLNSCDAIVAASTGPLHIAAALGKIALGIYPPIRPLHPQRWAPVGSKADFLVSEKFCDDCKINPSSCHCMNDIAPEMVANKLKDKLSH